MFKRTNKAWKALALVLALCMLSTTIVYAADSETAPATATVSITTTADNAYNEATSTATITGAITGEKDVTIIAIRDAETVAEAAFKEMTAETLQAKVVYIDQVETDTTGAYSFSFIPRTSVAGGKITVFVGGEDVSAIQTLSFDAKVTAPALVPQTWYEGEDTLQIKLVKQNDANTLYGDGAAAWAEKINAVTVDGADKKAATSYNEETGMLEINGFALTGASVSSITITTTANEYTDATWTGTAAQAKKTPGTLTAPAATVIAGNAAEITVANADDTWAGALADSVYVGGTKVDGVTYADGKLSVPMTIAADAETADVVVTVTQDHYNDATATVKVVAPTVEDAEDLEPSVAYSATVFETEDPAYATDFSGLEAADQQRLFGKASITLPGTGANGSTIAWTIDGTPATADTEIALTRPASTADDSAKIVVVATVTKTDYKTIEKTFNLNVNRINDGAKVAPENVTNLTATAFGIADAKVATVKLEKGTIDPEKQNITVGTTKFFYAPERSTSANDVFVAILRDNNADATAISDVATIEDGASEKLYYGKVSYTTSSDALTGADAAAAKRLNKNPADWTDAEYLAFDVYGTGQVSGAHAACIVRANKSQVKTEFSVISE